LLAIWLAVPHDPAVALIASVDVAEPKDELYVGPGAAQEVVARHTAGEARVANEREPACKHALDETGDSIDFLSIGCRRDPRLLQQRSEQVESESRERVRRDGEERNATE
jgi:hypothetical protein